MGRVNNNLPLTTTSKKTIAIVGAGVSGLQAARTILQSPDAEKFDVVMFEARDRIGGRAWTNHPWKFPLDFGANFIHGTDDNPLSDIAEKVGSTLIHNISMRRYYDRTGRPLDSKTANFLYRKVWEYSDAASDYSRQEEVDPKLSVEDFCQDKLNRDKEIESGEMRSLVGNAVDMLSGIAACDLDKLSLKYYWMEDDLPGDRPFIDSTYGPIVEYIAQPAVSQNLIKFNTQITSIDINTSAKSKAIALKTTASEIFYADSLIVTLPLGQLKENTVKFTPPLPSPVQTAISNLGFGVLEKLFIRFSSAWWLTPISKHESKFGLEFYRFTSLLSTLQTSLPRGTLNFFSLARTHNPQPVFGIYVSTDLAKHLVAMPKSDLKDMLQTYYIPHLPNYNASDPACQILEVGSSSWSLDPFSGYGSYTHIPAGSDTGDGNMKVLGERIMMAGEGGMWFAGEHTADTEVIEREKYTTMATVTGAYKSGERAAKHVLEHYSK